MIRYVDSVENEEKIETTFQITLRLQWVDHRLQFNSSQDQVSYLTLNEFSRVWHPDIFFKRMVSVEYHTQPTPNTYVRIFPDGTVLWSTRLTVRMAGGMDYRNLPFDMQTHSLMLASYGYTAEEVNFIWKENSSPLQITSNLHGRIGQLVKAKTDYCNSRTPTGSYSCLRADFSFVRESTGIINAAYIPTLAMVILSWLALWLDPVGQLAPRMVMGLLSHGGVMVISSKYSVVPAHVIGYSTMYDFWMGWCCIFTFAGFLTTVVVHVILRCKTKDAVMAEAEKGKNWFENKMPKCLSFAHPVDLLSIILILLGFVIFNIAYWVQVSGIRSDQTCSNEDNVICF